MNNGDMVEQEGQANGLSWMLGRDVRLGIIDRSRQGITSRRFRAKRL